MLRVATLASEATVRDQNEMEILIPYLGHKGYTPVLRHMLKGAFGLIKSEESFEPLVSKMIAESPGYRFAASQADKTILGDLFITDDVLYVLNTREEQALIASAVGYGKQEESLHKFCRDIDEGINSTFDGRRVRGMRFSWKLPARPTSMRSRYRSPIGEEMLDEEAARELKGRKMNTPKYTAEDVQAAKFLVDIDTRQFVRKVAQVTKLMRKDAVEVAKTSQSIERLQSVGLMAEEYLLTCRNDQHTICVVPSKDHHTKPDTASLRCSVCGRSFGEENLQVIYTLTPRAKKLMDGSSWMSIWVADLLEQNGVKRECLKWNIESGGDELDIIIDDFDSRLFMELKDREFGLGDAYPFVFRLIRCGGQVGLVVTTDKVSTDAKKFFEEETRRREYPIKIRLLEGSDSIQRDIVKVLEETSMQQIRRTIRPLTTRIGIDLWPIVECWQTSNNPKSEEKTIVTKDSSQ